VQARDAQVSLQNTKLSRRTPPVSGTVHWQLAQAHLVRLDRLTAGLAFVVCFMWPPLWLKIGRRVWFGK
jgi:hypothetical protein